MSDNDDLRDDKKAAREEALAQRMSLPRALYQQVIRRAVTFTLAQVADADVRPWRTWGARNIGGRIRALAQHPTDPNVLYAGSAQGGVFKTTDRGETWLPLGRPQDSFPVGALAIAPSDPTIIYVGTGEPVIRHRVANPPNVDAVERIPAGVGFFRYDEGTDTYSEPAEVGPAIPPAPVGGFPLGAANSYSSIAVDPHERERCWIASNTGLWKREAGPVFTRENVPPPPAALPAFPAPGAYATDVVLSEKWDETNHRGTYRLLVALGSVGIFRGIFDPANPAVAIVWEATNGLPAANTLAARTFDRIRVAVCSNFPDHVYAVLEDASVANMAAVLDVYHSSDGGMNWARCTGALPGLGRQSYYDLAIAVHPDNPKLVVIGAMELARSVNSGNSWEPITDQTIFKEEPAQHPDYHALIFDLENRNALWNGNDGGVSYAPDVVNVNPLSALSWRKRSHGLSTSQFNDITSSPTYPFMLGGGLQDNSAYVGYGGPTWYLLDAGDGGQFGFEVRNPRLYMAPDQNQQWIAQVVTSNFVMPFGAPNEYMNHSVFLADQPGPPNDDYAIFMSCQGEVVGIPANGQHFIAILTKHRATPGHVLLGRVADLIATTDFGTTYANGGIPGLGAAEEVRAVQYGINGAAAAADWWAGTHLSQLFRGTGPGPGKAWANVTPPGVVVLPAGSTPFTSIAVHPNNNNYIAVATGGVVAGTLPANTQGTIYISNNNGANWMNITGLAVAFNLSGAAPAALPTPLNSLPPCPITSLAFDPSVPAGDPQVLFAGTLGGVYVIRNLPPLPAGPPPPIVIPPPFNPDWHPFNGTAAVPLPLTLVNDLELVRLPARPGARLGSPESAARSRLYAALFGRGIYVCDVTRVPDIPVGLAPGGPGVRLFIRQHLVEDGLSYPRITPAVLNTAPTALADYNRPELDGDPRQPVGPAFSPASPPRLDNRFDDVTAYDIRVDNEPFQFFDEVLDGVEFDTELKTKSIVPGQLNAIYVQVHTAGWDRADDVDVHLFFAAAPAPPPGTGADPNPLPDLQPDFWTHFTDEPQLAAPILPLILPAAFWQRIGRKKVIPATRLSPSAPAVMRFEWVPPANLAGGFVGLLAVCTSAADPLPIPVPGGPAPQPAPMPTNLRNLIRAEPRVAFRLVATTAFAPDVYIRDSVDDDGVPGSGGFAGRSPDIIVVQSPSANPAADFRDLLDPHAGDRIRAGVAQTIYVRVHNRRSVPVEAIVEVRWSKPNVPISSPEPNAPVFDGSTWTLITPAVGLPPITVPANSYAFAEVTWPLAAMPPLDTSEGAFNAIALIALVSSNVGSQDRVPVRARVRDTASFWQFFQRMADSNNAAMRALLFEP